MLPFGLREALGCFFSLRSYKGKFVKTKRIRAKVSYKTKDTTDFCRKKMIEFNAIFRFVIFADL